MRSSSHGPSLPRAMLLLMFVMSCLLGLAALTGNLDYVLRPMYEDKTALTPGIQFPVERYVDVFEWDFDSPAALKEWDEKSFNGKTEYSVLDAGGGEMALRIRSSASASALYHKADLSVASRPVIAWKWRAAAFPPPKPAGAEKKREYDDYVGRVYVIFKSRSIFSADIIEYTWENDLPEGTSFTSPYSEHAKMLVVQTGPQPPDEPWVAERRDIAEDYRKLFGKPPAAAVAAVALMSDSDNMRATTDIWIKRIALKVPPQGEERSE